MLISFEQSLTYRELIALYADVAGALLGLGRPAALARVSFTKGFDRNYVVDDDWPGVARYEGDGVVVTADVECIDDGGNPRDGWAYRCLLRCTIPNAPALWLDDSTASPSQLALNIHVDDCDIATLDRIRALVAPHAKSARDRTDDDWIADSNAQAAETLGHHDDAATFRARVTR